MEINLRLRLFVVAVSYVLVLQGLACSAKDTHSKTPAKMLVPTIAPPTAEWPVFPTSESQDKDKPAQDTNSASGASATEVSPAGTNDAPKAPTETPDSQSAEIPSANAGVAPTPVAPAEPVALTPAQMEPHKRPVPEGYNAAAELFKQKKFPQAQKAFENIIKSGVADVNTHLCLGHCFLQQKMYSKAVKEFDWLSEHAKNSISLKNTCGATARSLRYYMSGVCPSPCIKANDPRWHLINGKRWITIRYSSRTGMNYSEHHIGEIIANENGVPVSKGQCPTCGGTGQIAKLKDGDPMPRL